MAAKQAGRLIVVAVDDGKESNYALSWCLDNVVTPPTAAAAAAEKEGGDGDKLVLVNARPLHPYAGVDRTGFMLSVNKMTIMDEQETMIGNSIMEEAMNLCANYPHVKVETIMEVGDAREVICEVVKKKTADMLVMGSHGYGMIQRALLGSVSNHCVHHVKCPCLVVKKPKSK